MKENKTTCLHLFTIDSTSQTVLWCNKTSFSNHCANVKSFRQGQECQAELSADRMGCGRWMGCRLWLTRWWCTACARSSGWLLSGPRWAPLGLCFLQVQHRAQVKSLVAPCRAALAVRKGMKVGSLSLLLSQAMVFPIYQQSQSCGASGWLCLTPTCTSCSIHTPRVACHLQMSKPSRVHKDAIS